MNDVDRNSTTNLWRVFDIYRQAGVLDDGIIVENIAFFTLLWHFRDNPTLLKKLGLDSHRKNEFRKRAQESGTNVLFIITELILSMTPAGTTSRILNEIVDEFEFARSMPGYHPDKSLIPSAPSNLNVYQYKEVAQLLGDIFTQVSDFGEWFDEVLIPHLTANPRGGRYATPRHLTHFLARLVKLSHLDSIADLACGTGGFLVSGGIVQHATGVEISPNVARLALTNLLLHGQTQHDLYLANTFALMLDDEKFREAKFDVVLMNPPFGMKIEPSLAYQAFSGEITGRSETLFTLLAYQKLTYGGRMAVMVPSGVLFSGGRGENYLRKILVEETALQAVIQLPRDANQPYVSIPTYILYAVKPKKSSDRPRSVWFIHARSDGLTSGRNRLPDPEHNDLPLIEAVLTTEGTGEIVQVTPLRGDQQILGYRVESDGKQQFVISAAGEGILVESTRNNEPFELIYSDSRGVFRGAPVVQPLTLKQPTEHTLNGKYSLTDLIYSVEENPPYSLMLANGRGEIRKGTLEKARFGIQTKEEHEAFGVLVDSDGKIISPIITLKMDLPGKDRRHLGYILSSDNERKIYLLILYNGLKGISLSSPSYSLYYIPPANNSNLVLFYNKKIERFEWSFTITIKPSGEIESGLPNVIFKSDDLRNGVVLNTKYEILGISVLNEVILNTKGVDLQWEKYWLEEKTSAVDTRSSAQILGDIKKNQNRISNTIDRLLSIAELQSIGTAQLPPHLNLITPPDGLLSGVQKAVWNAIRERVERIDGYETPKPFQADDIQSILEVDASVMDVQRALELFERMGLIAAVTYEGILYYRLLTDRDVQGM